MTYGLEARHLPPEHGPLGTFVRAVLNPVRKLWTPSPPRLMQMNLYSLNVLFQTLQEAGARRLFANFTNHDGHYGVQLLFRKEQTGAKEEE